MLRTQGGRRKTRRAKRGRPRSAQLFELVSVRFPPDSYQKLQLRAIKLRQPMSMLVRNLVTDYLERKEKAS